MNFFPDQYEDPGPAKAVCSRCLLAADCAAWALEQYAFLAGDLGRHRPLPTAEAAGGELNPG